jgi:hypothetical protein
LTGTDGDFFVTVDPRNWKRLKEEEEEEEDADFCIFMFCGRSYVRAECIVLCIAYDTYAESLYGGACFSSPRPHDGSDEIYFGKLA